MLRQCIGLLRPFLRAFLIGLVILSSARLGLAVWHADAVTTADGWRQIFLSGLRVDVASMCMLLVLTTVAWLLLPSSVSRQPAVLGVFALCLSFALVLPFALELATPPFMAEYGLRPNRLFIEYLEYPKEVGSTLVKGHLLAVLLALVLDALAIWLVFGRARAWLRQSAMTPAGWMWRLPLALAVLLLSALGIRSTLGHRPMNPAMVAFSSDATVNSLALNSFYSVAHAVRDGLRQDPGSRIYDPMTSDDAVAAAMREEVALAGGEVESGELPVLVRWPAAYHGKPRNLVIVLEESLGAQFIGSLGGMPLSPNYDRLVQTGWAFERLYATGTRSVRGIEAVLSGYPPTPSLAVVKRPKAQQDFFTLAGLLRRHGYDTTFYYGGESHFDNMRGFFLGNGFVRVIDENDYPDPEFRGSWGVSDEDLFRRADTEFRQLHAAGTPFFGFVFTSSNHDPFEFPGGRIDLYEEPRATRNNAAKYADHALGLFFELARQSDYWADTVFLIVADHDSRALGQSLVPVDNFHIPGLILGAGIEPRRDPRLISQIDLAPTLLSLIGIDDATPMIGHDLTRPDSGGRAPMQYDYNFALMTEDRVVILQPEQVPMQFTYNSGKPLQQIVSPDDSQIRRVRDYALWGTVAYEQGWYRLPPDDERLPVPAGAVAHADLPGNPRVIDAP